MIVLGVDPGEKRSGWAIAADHERIVASGVARNAAERADAVLEAKRRGVTRVSIEWVTAGGGTMRVAMGIGQARGRWLEQVEQVLGISKRSTRIVTPNPQQWRSATHGTVRAQGDRRQKAEQFKRAARAYVGIDDPDEAEAACIALYGAAMVAEGAA